MLTANEPCLITPTVLYTVDPGFFNLGLLIMLINLHTHRQTKEGEKSIRSLYENFGEAAWAGYSIGVHPCHISKPWLAQFEEIKDHSRLSNVVAIGETGLDKICSTEWPLQQLSFTAHIQWAVFPTKAIDHSLR